MLNIKKLVNDNFFNFGREQFSSEPTPITTLTPAPVEKELTLIPLYIILYLLCSCFVYVYLNSFKNHFHPDKEYNIFSEMFNSDSDNIKWTNIKLSNLILSDCICSCIWPIYLIFWMFTCNYSNNQKAIYIQVLESLHIYLKACLSCIISGEEWKNFFNTIKDYFKACLSCIISGEEWKNFFNIISDCFKACFICITTKKGWGDCCEIIFRCIIFIFTCKV